MIGVVLFDWENYFPYFLNGIYIVLDISPYLVWMRENTDQEKLRIWILFTPWLITLNPQVQ